MTTRTMEQSETASGEGVYGFQNHGLNPTKDVHYNLSPAQLYEASFAKGDGQLVHMAPSPL